MNISPAQNNAAGALVDLIAGRLGTGRAVHAETAIACAARLSGSLLLRSFNLNLAALVPGTVILSELANEQGPQLINIMSAVLQKLGVTLDQSKLGGEPLQKGEEPVLAFVPSIEMFQNEAMAIARENGLSLVEAAQAGAVATAFIVRECARNIGAEAGFNAAIYAMIEGCKTVPPVMPGAAVKAQVENKAWYKFW